MKNHILEIETDRLILNRPTDNDLPDFFEQINSCEDFSRNLFNIPYPFPPENLQTWLRKWDEDHISGEIIRFAIREKAVGKLIGTIGLHLNTEHQKAELGYWISRNYWGNGYLTEVLKAVIQYGFTEFNLNKIFATHFLYNPGSEKVMQKAGMKFEGLLRKEYLQNGQFEDVNRYSILKSDFNSDLD